MKKPVSLVIFDLDNTLWDWVKIWGRSFDAMLQSVASQSGVSVDVRGGRGRFLQLFLLSAR